MLQIVGLIAGRVRFAFGVAFIAGISLVSQGLIFNGSHKSRVSGTRCYPLSIIRNEFVMNKSILNAMKRLLAAKKKKTKPLNVAKMQILPLMACGLLADLFLVIFSVIPGSRFGLLPLLPDCASRGRLTFCFFQKLSD